jgi:hypothetical protein
LFDDERKAMQARFVTLSESPTGDALQSCWDEHLALIIPRVDARVAKATRQGAAAHHAFSSYWEKQNRLDHFPAGRRF